MLPARRKANLTSSYPKHSAFSASLTHLLLYNPGKVTFSLPGTRYSHLQNGDGSSSSQNGFEEYQNLLRIKYQNTCHTESPVQTRYLVDSTHFPAVCSEMVDTETWLSLKTGPFSEINLLRPPAGSPNSLTDNAATQMQPGGNRCNDPANSRGGETIRVH